jgi:hypothetical protein
MAILPVPLEMLALKQFENSFRLKDRNSSQRLKITGSK